MGDGGADDASTTSRNSGGTGAGAAGELGQGTSRDNERVRALEAKVGQRFVLLCALSKDSSETGWIYEDFLAWDAVLRGSRSLDMVPDVSSDLVDSATVIAVS